MARRPLATLVLLAPTLLSCGLSASSEPMGDPIELGGACDQAPEATGVEAGEVSPNLVVIDQYGETIDLHADLCDRHVVLVRAGFD